MIRSMAFSDKVLERFWAKVKRDEPGCWVWTASKFWDGYGKFRLGATMVKAHRISFEIHNGQIPDGLHVLHKCDNPACVNPEHLFSGSHAENMADKEAKARGVSFRGSKHGRAKLTEADVAVIRAARGVTQQQLADQFGVSNQLISRIKSGGIWRD